MPVALKRPGAAASKTAGVFGARSAAPVAPQSPFVDPEAVKKFFEDEEANNPRTARRPEFMIKDGEEKQILIRHNGPIWHGKIHKQFIESSKTMVLTVCAAPQHGVCPCCDVGWYSQPVAVWEFVDIGGYTSAKGKNKGKHMANIPCYYIANKDRHAALMRFVEKTLGGRSESRIITVNRIGNQGINLTFTAENQAPARETLSVPSLVDKMDEYWASPEPSSLQKLATWYLGYSKSVNNSVPI